jgi:hypothetical protein
VKKIDDASVRIVSREGGRYFAAPSFEQGGIKKNLLVIVARESIPSTDVVFLRNFYGIT